MNSFRLSLLHNFYSLKMEIKLLTNATALIVSEKVILATVNDAVNIIGNCKYSGVDNIIVNKNNIRPTFFDLKTGLAGEVLQKFSTYNMKLAVIGTFNEYTSNSWKDFMYESNKIGRIVFLDNIKEVLKRFEG